LRLPGSHGGLNILSSAGCRVGGETQTRKPWVR
jgi:hypothetical protein